MCRENMLKRPDNEMKEKCLISFLRKQKAYNIQETIVTDGETREENC